ncbi:MAG: low affinity iron permease family protein [Mesorhizobium sp.]
MEKIFTRVANRVAYATGTPIAFMLCVSIVVIWAISGPIFDYSDTWQLIINTGTTIVTFLMVFLIQNTQNRDGAAIQAKLDELIRVSEAKNHFIGIEHLTESEVEEIRRKCEQAAKRAEQGEVSNSVSEDDPKSRRKPAARKGNNKKTRSGASA